MTVHYELADLHRWRPVRGPRLKEALHWMNHAFFVPFVLIGVFCAIIPAVIVFAAVIAHDAVWHRIHDL